MQSNRFPHDKMPENEEITARGRFDWFDWLHKSDPSCPLAKQALDEVSEAYPSFDPKEPHPDLTSYVVLGGQGQPRVPSVEELLGKPPSYWGDKLLSVEDADEEGPTHATLIQNLAEATRRNFDWSLRLAQALGGIGKWDVYPWYALINTWGQMELEEHQHLQVFTWLESPRLYPKHSREIADALSALVEDGGPSYAIRLLPRANQIAEELWQHLDRTITLDENRGWFNQSADYPIWGLVNFWISSVWLWRRHQDPAPITLSEDYHRPLLEIIKDTSPIGGLGKSILTSQLRYLLGVDEEWTRNHLLPLFERDSADFQAAWDGFVAVGRVSPPVAEALKEPFLNAVTRINTDLFDQRRGFTECYTVMLVYVVEDVLDTWIPNLFKYGSQQSQQANCESTFLRDDNSTIPEVFTCKVGECLERMNDSESQELWQRWLKDYWWDRIHGRPAPLTPKEAELMLEWLPELDQQFDEAVDLAVKMPSPSFDDARILACLVTNESCKNHPEAVATLLIYLWDCNIPVWHQHCVPKIIAPLLDADISSELKQKLKDISIQL